MTLQGETQRNLDEMVLRMRHAAHMHDGATMTVESKEILQMVAEIDRLRLLVPREVAWQPTHLHFKGGAYRVKDDTVRAAGNIKDGDRVVLYGNANGQSFVRTHEEFHGTVTKPRFDAVGDLLKWPWSDPVVGGAKVTVDPNQKIPCARCGATIVGAITSISIFPSGICVCGHAKELHTKEAGCIFGGIVDGRKQCSCDLYRQDLDV